MEGGLCNNYLSFLLYFCCSSHSLLFLLSPSYVFGFYFYVQELEGVLSALSQQKKEQVKDKSKTSSLENSLDEQKPKTLGLLVSASGFSSHACAYLHSLTNHSLALLTVYTKNEGSLTNFECNEKFREFFAGFLFFIVVWCCLIFFLFAHHISFLFAIFIFLVLRCVYERKRRNRDL